MREETDSIEQVIREWEAQPGRSVSYGDLGIVFTQGPADVAAWRRAASRPTFLGYMEHLTPESDRGFQRREATVSDLRAALGLPAWTAPPATTQEELLSHDAEGRTAHIQAAHEKIQARFAEKRAKRSGDAPPTMLPLNPTDDVDTWRADPTGGHHPDSATPEEFARAVDRLGGAGSWTAVAALRMLERAERAEANTQALVAAHKKQVERLLAEKEGALTIRLNPNAAGSIPGTDWQVDYPGQYSSHPNAQAAWIEAGILLGVLDDGEGVAGLTRGLLTRVEQIEALLMKRAARLRVILIENNWPHTGDDEIASLKAAIDVAREQFARMEAELEQAKVETDNARRLKEAEEARAIASSALRAADDRLRRLRRELGIRESLPMMGEE